MKIQLLALTALLLTSCSFSKYSEVEYNNTVVQKINEASLAIEATATLYNSTVPDVVSEQDTIELDEMEDSYDEALSKWEATEDLSTLESRNLEQQNAVRTELETYRSAGELYLQSYADMLEYYDSEAYKEDLSQVKTLDESLHINYTTFIEANNNLVEALDGFVQAE